MFSQRKHCVELLNNNNYKAFIMIFFASLAAALGITLFLVSYIAKMLHAKRPGIGWVFLAWITGTVLAALVMIPLGMFGQSVDPLILFIATIVLSLLISSAAYKYINQMGWGGAITTNIASSVIGLVAMVLAVVLSGNSIKDTFSSIDIAGLSNPAMLDSMKEDDFSEHSAYEDTDLNSVDNDGQALVSVDEDDDMDPVFKETDLLPKGAVKEMQVKVKPYVSPKYHVVSIGSINSLVGRSIRISKSNKKVVAGALVRIRGNDVIVKQRIHGGEATVPVSLASIHKLEVYR